MQWFGRYWPSALTWTESENVTAIPVGVFCSYGPCSGPIDEDDQGVIVPSPFFDEAFAGQETESYLNVVERRRRQEMTQVVFHRACFENWLIEGRRVSPAD